MGLDNPSNISQINKISISIVTGQNIDKNNELLSYLNAVQTKEGQKLFQIQSCNVKEARVLLENNKITGFITNNNEPILYIKETGAKQTVIKFYIDKFEQSIQSATLNQIERSDKTVQIKQTEQPANINDNYIRNDTEDKYKNESFIPFYALIAFSCMLGAVWGFNEIISIQPDQSKLGARLGVTPVRKIKLLVCNYFAAFTIHFASVMILVLFLYKVLNIQFGGRSWMVLLTCILGSLCGICLGAMLCVTIHANFKVREAILNTIIIGGVLISGMIIPDVKFTIQEKFPFLSFINPAGLITDSLYSLYYYSGYGRYFINMAVLSIMTFIFITFILINVRRKEYASI
jgi:ABC-2 type transport system permease protein